MFECIWESEPVKLRSEANNSYFNKYSQTWNNRLWRHLIKRSWPYVFFAVRRKIIKNLE